MRRRAFVAAVGASVALSGCSGSGDTGSDYDVGMANNRFKPTDITVSAGSTIVWKNTSSSSHTVTAYADAIPDGAAYFASGDFESETAAREGWGSGDGSIYQDQTYEHTFEQPGTYEYFCIPHESVMIGTVVVTPAATDAATPPGSDPESTTAAPENATNR
jgi:plastocyanin